MQSKSKSILITGATGFYGRYLLPVLLESGHRVVALVEPKDTRAKQLDSNVIIRKGDITSAESIKDVLAGMNDIDIVLHMGGLVANPDPDLNLDVNFHGTQNLLNEVNRFEKCHFIYVSAVAAIYTNRTAYGESKFRAEEAVRKSGIPYTIVRPTLTYGNGGYEFSEFLKYINKFPVVPIIGPGEAKKQPVWVGDVVQALTLIIQADKRKVAGKEYGISGADVVTFKEMVQVCGDVFSKSKPIISLPLWFCKLLARFLGKFTKNPPITLEVIEGINQDAALYYEEIESDLGYSPQLFREGLAKAFNL